MSFADYKVLQLKKVAKQTATDLGEAKTADEIIAALEANGVTYEYYEEKFLNAADEKAEKPAEPKAAKKKNAVVRLVTGWALLETEWGVATQAAPFLVVDESEVAKATASGDFRVASAEEVKEAYGLNK